MNGLAFPSKRARIFENVSDGQWNDWHWQIRHCLRSPEDFQAVLPLTESEQAALHSPDLFRVAVTPYFASLINPEDPHDPIRRQMIPLAEEIVPFAGMMEDSLAEDLHSPVPGLVHRYPDRVLMLVTTQCASYCRYCTRSRIVGDAKANFNRVDFEDQLDYLRKTPQVRDVLLSGGDPLTLAPGVLEELLGKLRSIPHIEVIRIGTRVPVFMPMRVTTELCNMLQQFHPLWMNIHVNHPNEITAELAAACDRLTRAGIPLGNQTVLLAGINDCVHVQRKLVQELVKIRVRPYYLYQCDLVEGAGHFRTPVAKGIEIMEGLRGHTSGFCVPAYIVDVPGGGGKVPLLPNYHISSSDHKIILRNYEGFVAAYEEPLHYEPHDPGTCEYCRNKHSEVGQTGITGLLDGDGFTIQPQGFNALHQRGGRVNRLRTHQKDEK